MHAMTAPRLEIDLDKIRDYVAEAVIDPAEDDVGRMLFELFGHPHQIGNRAADHLGDHRFATRVLVDHAQNASVQT